MAFNPYYTTYYPTAYQPSVPQQPTQNSLLWVRGIGEAQMYPVAPNNAVALWDSSAPVLYLKQSDAAGRTGMKIYDLTERVESVPERGGMSVPEYATKSDLAQFNSALEQMRADIDRMRRKPTRRTEDDE